MKTYYLITGFLWLLSWQLQAQGSTQITLNQAVRMGLENSKQLKVAYAKTQEAQSQLAQAKQRQYPTVDMSAAYLRVNSPHIVTHFAPPRNDTGQPTATATPEVSQVAYGIVNVTQPLFTGFRLHHSVEAAAYLKRAAELNAESQKEDIALNIVAAYYNFYKLEAAHDLVEQSLEQAQQRVKVFANLEHNGVITRNDLLKAQLQQSNIELTLVDIDNNIEVANFDLGILLGLPENTVISIDTTQISDVAPTAEQAAFYLQQAQTNRLDLKAASTSEKAAHANTQATKGGYYPSVAITGGYVNAHIPGLLTVTNAVNAGVGLQYSLSGIFDTRHQVQEARARQDESALTTAMQADQIKSEVFKDYADYQKSLKKIETLKVASQQAAENFRITQNNYNNSLALITDLLDAEVARLQTRVDQLHAKADAQLSFYQLEKAAGLLSQDFTIQP